MTRTKVKSFEGFSDFAVNNWIREREEDHKNFRLIDVKVSGYSTASASRIIAVIIYTIDE